MINAPNKIQRFLILKHYFARLKWLFTFAFAFLSAEDYARVSSFVEKCVIVFALMEASHKLVIMMNDGPLEQKENGNDKGNVKEYHENAHTHIDWLIMHQRLQDEHKGAQLTKEEHATEFVIRIVAYVLEDEKSCHTFYVDTIDLKLHSWYTGVG